MARTITTALLIAFIVGCGGAASRPVVVPPRGSVKIQPWPRDRTDPLWSETARRVQAIITSSPRERFYLLWVVEAGTRLAGVYAVPFADSADMYARIHQQRPLPISIVHTCTDGGGHALLVPRRPGSPPASREGAAAIGFAQPSGGSTGSPGATTVPSGAVCLAYKPPMVDINPPGDPDPEEIRLVLELAGHADAGYERFLSGIASREAVLAH